jgi:cyclic beta-1,2-glucan synthetase
LLADWADADVEHVDNDLELLEIAANGIARLNARHEPATAGDRFYLLHRRRIWSEGQQQWMGWERKRGKLHELNRLLRGAEDTTFIGLNGQPVVWPRDVRYVLTLDADTRVPREMARRLIGKMAHPLNRPRFDAAVGRVVEGYAVMQPRVTPSLPLGREGSLFQRVFSSMNGIDPYAAAVSDVYQDLLGEGSYAGKGIYEIDAFEQALADRAPEGSLLSHDLFEGIFARAALASDIEVIEEFPSRYDVAVARQHRWARGDWQLLPWIFGRRDLLGRGNSALPLIGRWKMLDNLRRTLSAPACLAALIVGWLLPFDAAVVWTLFVLGTIALPSLLPVLSALAPRRRGILVRSHYHALGGELWQALQQIVLHFALLAHQAWLMIDAILRTVYRLLRRRNLLEWVTAAQLQRSDRPGVAATYLRMLGSVMVAVLLLIGVAMGVGSDYAIWLAVPMALLWIAAPAIAVSISMSPLVAGRLHVSRTDAQSLRRVARRTWSYFETFVTAEHHMLPPDNFQEDPKPVVAHRTSPTNIGLYLLCVVSARDFGWLGTADAVERLEATLDTMRKMQR